MGRGQEDAWLDDAAFFAWKDDQRNYEEKLKELRVQKVLLQLSNIDNSTSDVRALPQGLAALPSKMEPSSRSQLVEELRKVIS
ncbi:hypothetical protein SLE2022_326810 [Rubroshorea leprosula]